jgi:hypothetical protein
MAVVLIALEFRALNIQGELKSCHSIEPATAHFQKTKSLFGKEEYSTVSSTLNNLSFSVGIH